MTFALAEDPWYALNLSDVVIILAILAAPWIAIYIQRRLDAARESRNRKHMIFRTLMATRAARVSNDHVSALNMIDLEFYGKRRGGRRRQSAEDRAVTEAWRIYLDSLDYGSADDDAILAARIERSGEKFVDLLFAMSRALGYDFDRVLLRKGVYTPEAHGTVQQQQTEILAGLASLVKGEAAIPILPIVSEDTEKAQKRLRKLLDECLSGKRSLSVVVSEPDDSSER